MATPTLVVGTNTYVSRADAEDIVDSRLYPGSWATATDDDKDKALLQATSLLDQMFTWAGTPRQADLALQPLDWPRYGVIDEDGRSIDSETIPALIIKGTVELAIWLLGTDVSEQDTGSDDVKKVKADVVEVTFQDGASSSSALLPDYIVALLAPYGSLTPRAAGKSGGMVRLRRG